MSREPHANLPRLASVRDLHHLTHPLPVGPFGTDHEIVVSLFPVQPPPERGICATRPDVDSQRFTVAGVCDDAFGFTGERGRFGRFSKDDVGVIPIPYGHASD